MAKPAIRGAIDEMIFRKCCGFLIILDNFYPKQK